VHIPFLLDGNPTTWYRGKQLMDGSLYDFIFGNNSGLITCGGNAFVVDYVSIIHRPTAAALGRVC